MTMMRPMLIKGGFIVTGDPELGNIPGGDVAISDGRIVAVGNKLADSDVFGDCAAPVINARGMYVCPGFIDTHRHVWETLLRAAAVDSNFGQYFVGVLDRFSPRVTPQDMRLAGHLAGLEALDAGVTTVLDWCHAALTVEHAQAAVLGLQASGARFVYAYGPPHPQWFDDNGLPTPAQVTHLHSDVFGNNGYDASGLGSMALAIRGPEFSSMQRTADDLELARILGIPVTMHAGIPGFYQHSNTVQMLKGAGLLGPDLTFVHMTAAVQQDFDDVAAAGGHISFAPEVEMQMGLGAAPIRLARNAGITPSLSVDVTVAAPGDLFTQARIALQTQRMLDQQSTPPPQSLDLLAAEAFGWMTMGGAQTLGMADRLGSLTAGKRADILLIRNDDPNTLGFLSPQGSLPVDPRGAIALYAHAGNVDTVIVDGSIRKRRGRLSGWSGPAMAARLAIAQKHLTGSS